MSGIFKESAVTSQLHVVRCGILVSDADSSKITLKPKTQKFVTHTTIQKYVVNPQLRVILKITKILSGCESKEHSKYKKC